MHILVTGGSGFLGGHVVPLLVARGDTVTALARTSTAASRVASLGATPVAGDLDDPASLDEAFAISGAEALANLASLGFGHAPAIVAAAEEAGLKRAVFVSTTAIFTTLNAGSRSTREAAEETVRASALDWTILRPTMIYGTPADRNMARLLRLVARSPVVPLPGGGRRLQQPVHVDDVAGAVVAALDPLAGDTVHQAYDLAGPEPLAFRHIVEAASAAAGRRPRLVPVPLAAPLAVLRVYERLARRPRLKAEQLERLAEDKVFDLEPARRDLGYDPRPFTDGIAQEAALVRSTRTDNSGTFRRAMLFAHTARHLRPAQVAHRARLRTQKVALARLPSVVAPRLRRPLPADPGWPSVFEALDAQQAVVEAVAGGSTAAAEAMESGRFSFLGEERHLGHPADWEQVGADQLWRYHLHYFEWAWSLAAHPDRTWARAQFGRLWRSWDQGTTFGRWDAWSPYVVSLRAWAMCGLYAPLVEGTDLEADYLDQVALHAGFVRAHLEFDVGGNHLVKNLKALIGAGVFLSDASLVDLATRHLARQIQVQVLSDGGHYERSPSYHCQVLGDLIDVAGLLGAADRPLPVGLDDAIASMRVWLGAMLMPDGDVPLFNDCTRVGHRRLALLEPAPSPEPGVRLTVLQPSGYVVVRTGAGRFHLVADVGPPCPPELPAHAHADCLSFELAVDGLRLVVNSGTSTYEPGERRDYERSTAAHSTVEVDGQDQTEVWGAFRAARRAMASVERAEDDGEAVVVVASHDGYERLAGRPRQRRMWWLTDYYVRITDEVEGAGNHRSVARFILAPGTVVKPLGTSQFRAGGIDLSVSGGSCSFPECQITEWFGMRQDTLYLELAAVGTLPHRLVVLWAL